MRSLWRSVGGIIFLSLLLTQFTNCDVYSDNSLFQTFTSVCQGEECIQTNSEFLEIKVNSEGDIPISASVYSFDIGGECNEGGYPNSEVSWSLYEDGTFLVNSDDTGTTTACHMGRFQMRVYLSYQRPDGTVVIARPGLLRSGSRVPHRLEVEIKGISETGEVFENTLARRQVFLKPI